MKWIGMGLLRHAALAATAVAAVGCYAQREMGFQGYKAYLASQEGKANPLPQAFIDRAQASYGSSLGSVHFYTGIDTINGKVVTIGRKIYYPNNLDLTLPLHIKSLLHELKHVDQYSAMGDLFFQKYADQAITSSFGHDDMEYEAEAIAASESVFGILKLHCPRNVCREFVSK